jgi:hypothetical protein
MRRALLFSAVAPFVMDRSAVTPPKPTGAGILFADAPVAGPELSDRRA